MLLHARFDLPHAGAPPGGGLALPAERIVRRRVFGERVRVFVELTSQGFDAGREEALEERIALARVRGEAVHLGALAGDVEVPLGPEAVVVLGPERDGAAATWSAAGRAGRLEAVVTTWPRSWLKPRANVYPGSRPGELLAHFADRVRVHPALEGPFAEPLALDPEGGELPVAVLQRGARAEVVERILRTLSRDLGLLGLQLLGGLEVGRGWTVVSGDFQLHRARASAPPPPPRRGAGLAAHRLAGLPAPSGPALEADSVWATVEAPPGQAADGWRRRAGVRLAPLPVPAAVEARQRQDGSELEPPDTSTLLAGPERPSWQAQLVTPSAGASEAGGLHLAPAPGTLVRVDFPGRVDRAPSTPGNLRWRDPELAAPSVQLDDELQLDLVDCTALRCGKVSVKPSLEVEAAQDVSLAVGGDLEIQVEGDERVASTGALHKVERWQVEASRDASVLAGGDASFTSRGATRVAGDRALHHTGGGSSVAMSDGNIQMG